ncbi:MAG: SAVED domain-containing protein, partial [Patescibacteria group bacterium]
TLMYALGLRHDSMAVEQGVATVRRWVTDARRILTTDEIRHEVKSMNLEVAETAAIFLVQAIDSDPMPESATIALDWVGLYQGDEPKTRRRLYDNRLWNERLRPEIQKAKHSLRSKGFQRVLVRGYMRLPSWFSVGAELGETAGFEAITFQGGQEWSSNGAMSDLPVSIIRDEVIGTGGDLAIGVSLSVDLSDDVLAYLTSDVPAVGRYVCLAPTTGPNNRSIRDSFEARQWALNLRNQVRDVVRKYQPKKLHLFLATPGGAALLLGHLWDRMPDTQLYEDQGACNGYLPSFLIPN